MTTRQIIIEEGSQKNLLFSDENLGVEKTIEITLKPNSQGTFSYNELGASISEKKLTIIFTLEQGATLDLFTATLGSGNISTLSIEARLIGEGSSLRQRTIFLGRGTEHYDMHARTILSGKNTSAVIDSRGVLLDEAQASFDGGIVIEMSATGAQGHLHEHTLLLSPNARMDAIPALDIKTNEVQASHSASVTRVDDEQLFYANSRGIAEEEAVVMIAQGFLDELLEGTASAEILSPLIEQKLRSAKQGLQR